MVSHFGGLQIQKGGVTKSLISHPPLGFCLLVNLNLFYSWLLFADLDFWNVNGEDSVVDRGFDHILGHVLRKSEALFEFPVRELSAKIFPLLVILIFGFILLLHSQNEIIVVCDFEVEIFLGHSRSCDLDFVVIVVFNNIDGRSCCTCTVHPIIGEEIVEDFGQPILFVTSHRCHNHISYIKC